MHTTSKYIGGHSDVIGGMLAVKDEELFKKMLMTFDRKYEAASVFYDNLQYVRDYDLCNWTPLRMVSGNIIKYYQYKLDKPVILQTDPDGF